MNQDLNPDVVNFIEAQKQLAEAKHRLWQAEDHLGTCNRALSNAFFGERGSIPATFVVNYEEQFYLIRVDTEGDHAHAIERIDAIMGQVGATEEDKKSWDGVTVISGTCTCGHYHTSHDNIDTRCNFCSCLGFKDRVS